MSCTVPVYIAILTNCRHGDILLLFTSRDAAIEQCRYWLADFPHVRPYPLQMLGTEWFACYGSALDTARVERLELALDAQAVANILKHEGHEICQQQKVQ